MSRRAIAGLAAPAAAPPGWVFGLNFRSSDSFPNTADAPEDAWIGSDNVYPNPITNGNAITANVGFDATGALFWDGDATADPRLAGNNYSGSYQTFTIELEQGGLHSIDFALGGFQGSSGFVYLSDRWPWESGVFFAVIDQVGGNGRTAANNVTYADDAAWIAADGVRQIQYDFTHQNGNGKYHFTMFAGQKMHIQLARL